MMTIATTTTLLVGFGNFGQATVAFVVSILTRTGDDFTFKLLCNAFEDGLQFFFISTISPVILALTLVIFTTMAYCVTNLHLNKLRYYSVVLLPIRQRRQRQYYQSPPTISPAVSSEESSCGDDDHHHHHRHEPQSPFPPNEDSNITSISESSELTTTTSSNNNNNNSWKHNDFGYFNWLFKPSLAHIGIAILDQVVTLMATAGGPQTPGYAQVIINQSMVPLTAITSKVWSRREFTWFQIIASTIIVIGSGLAGYGVLVISKRDDEESIPNDPADDKETATTTTAIHLGKTLSVLLFFGAQIPNAIAHVWREHLLKSNSSSEYDDDDDDTVVHSNNDIPSIDENDNHNHSNLNHDNHHQRDHNYNTTSWKILRLATLVNIVRAVLSTIVGIVASFMFDSINKTMHEGYVKILQNTNNATSLLIINTITWLGSKLSILWVSSTHGGAFLSTIAGAVALPLEVMIFHFWLPSSSSSSSENPNLYAIMGLVLSIVGLIMYFWAVPEDFVSTTTSTDANGRRRRSSRYLSTATSAINSRRRRRRRSSLIRNRRTSSFDDEDVEINDDKEEGEDQGIALTNYSSTSNSSPDNKIV